MKLVRSLKNILREENKFNIKNHCVLSKAGRDEFGHLKINQDTYLFIKEINGIKNFDIFGVLDGHGPEGHFVSQLVSRYIQLEFQKIKAIERIKDVKIIYQKLSANNFSIIKDIFINADNFLRDQEIESRSSGTTCVLVVHIGNHIICANVGDSRAILIYDKNKDHDYKVFPLSIDNKPEMKEERERITKMGGKVEKNKE
jgi:serine/threonine protein phosphatase PrpC